jgi:AcrR family transcriptional regulator
VVPTPGLRSRKKHKTAQAIQDAALELFTQGGFDATTVGQIADRAEVSAATFFRYFATKEEVIFGGQQQELPSLHEAIVERPGKEGDLLAVRRAIVRTWVPRLDPERVARQHQVTASSPRLRASSLHIGIKWQIVISDALAERRGLRQPDQKARLTAGVAMAVVGNSVQSWVDNRCPVELATAIDHGFDLLSELGRRHSLKS